MKRCKHKRVIVSELAEAAREIVIENGEVQGFAYSDPEPTGVFLVECEGCRSTFQFNTRSRNVPKWAMDAFEVAIDQDKMIDFQRREEERLRRKDEKRAEDLNQAWFDYCHENGIDPTSKTNKFFDWLFEYKSTTDA